MREEKRLGSKLVLLFSRILQPCSLLHERPSPDWLPVYHLVRLSRCLYAGRTSQGVPRELRVSRLPWVGFAFLPLRCVGGLGTGRRGRRPPQGYCFRSGPQGAIGSGHCPVVEISGLEPLTSCLQSRRSTN